VFANNYSLEIQIKIVLIIWQGLDLNIDAFVKSPNPVTPAKPVPVPDQVRDDGSGSRSPEAIEMTGFRLSPE
jgi:hypothetical protein